MTTDSDRPPGAASRPIALAVLPATPQDGVAAARLGRRLNLPVVHAAPDPAMADAVLTVSGSRLSLQRTGKGAPGPVSVDFGSDAMRHRRRSRHNELLGRAVGVRQNALPRILDATAGLGKDSFVLADLGCHVTLCERDPVIFEMLRSGMRTAAATDAWLDEVLGRMRLCPGDARELPQDGLLELDVIYLDPMFSQRGKSAAVKKDMALLRLLLELDAGGRDGDDLLRWALTARVPRVVVKRAPKAPHLAGRQPSHSIEGKAVRYDVYQRRKTD